MKRPELNPSMENLHVLIVDDDEDTRVPTAELLRMFGCRVALASDGAMAVKQAIELEPDVILMDLTLPVMDGFQSTEQIRARSREGYHPYIIAISGYSDNDSRDLAHKVGCDDYMVKPVTNLAGLLREVTLRDRSSSRSPRAASPKDQHQAPTRR